MQKLARTEQPALKLPEMYVLKLLFFRCLIARSSKKPVITQTMQTRCLLLTNMFDPAEYVSILRLSNTQLTFKSCRETEPDWEKSLADDVKVECETKYDGKVEYITVDKESDRVSTTALVFLTANQISGRNLPSI